MIKHYIKVALRLIKRSMLFSSINMLGFVFGMTAAFLIYLWVVNELTYEDYNPDADRIYRVVEVYRKETGEIKESPSTIIPLVETFRKEFPQVETATIIKYENEATIENSTGKSISGLQAYADTAFFKVFTFEVVAGDLADMKRCDFCILSEPFAIKLFGSTVAAIGKKVKLPSDYLYKLEPRPVVAVVKIPPKCHIFFDVLFDINGVCAYTNGMHFNSMANREHHQVYVKMKQGDEGKMYQKEHKEMSQVLSKLGDKNTLVRFQPIKDIHLKTNFPDPDIKNHGSMASIYLFVGLAALVIFMGAFNFMTLSTARASLRYKEIGVRKVTGAKRKTLITQFLSESIVQAVISLMLALALTEPMLPFFNRVMNANISLSLSWSILFYILFGIIGVGCIAGSYPAFYLSSINPLIAFKGGQKTGQKGGLIRGLVCIQFVIAIFLMIVTMTVYKQLHYMQNKDLGLDKENIVAVYTNLWYDVGAFKQELMKNPVIKSVAMGSSIGNFCESGEWKDGAMTGWTDIDGKENSLKMLAVFTDADFLKTFDLKLIKGELPDDDYDNYWGGGGYQRTVVINETAWKAMKMADPIGTEFRFTEGWGGDFTFRIVGIVKDFNFQSLREQIKPAFICYNPEQIEYLFIKIAPERRQETLKFIQHKFEEMAPLFVKEFRYQYFSDALNKNYTKEQQQSRMLLFFTVLAIVIAMMGVFGLVSLSTEQRTKEIGIRKVNGAHSDCIVRMFCREYLKWVGIAFVIACPLGYFFMQRWLTEFAYQTSISWWLFVLAGVLIGGITLLTVICQTWRKASQNPVKSLRYE
ncbi:ABC transporter permease [Bacteroides sp.]|uniref:ABC transporter permease n=1 Tax=Bacteroides sp. TaxID=29523 RepID=UPI002630C2A5|nr:ABC transporter permease [Bacteroides sp.]